MSRFTVVLLFCMAALVVAAPKKKVSQSDGKIVGGQQTNINEVPYQVSLQYKGQHFCGGSIIDSRHILTAAHCVAGFDYRQMSVRVGSSLHYTGGEVHKVRKATAHPGYNKDTTNNDIAVLELETAIRSSSGAKIIHLATTEPRPGEKAKVSGWGAMHEGGDSASTLQSVIVPVISRESCRRQYARFNNVNENMWCAGYPEGKKDACQGDSGGPAVVNGKLAGVVSWGAGCARRNSPGVYANIPRYLSWIAQHSSVRVA